MLDQLYEADLTDRSLMVALVKVLDLFHIRNTILQVVSFDLYLFKGV